MSVRYVVSSRLPTPWAVFDMHGFEDLETGKEHVVLTLGEVGAGAPVLCRVHSECLTGDALFSLTTADALQRQVAGGAVRGLVLKAYVDDVDAHFARARAEGAAIVGEPEDGFWGGRIYRARDPEGHLWEISQRGRDLPAEAWQLPPGVRRGKPK